MIIIQFDLLSKVNPIFYKGDLSECDELWHYEDIMINYDRFYYIIDGECIIEINNTSFIAKKGQLFFLPVHSKLTLKTGENKYLKKYWIHCRLQCDNVDFSEVIKYPYFITVKNPAEIEDIFKKIIDSASSLSLATKIEQKAYILKLLSYYINFVDRFNLGIEHDSKIQRIISFVDDNLHRNISLKELSVLAGFHPNYFIRYFKAATGFTPTSFINERRILLSQKLLLEEKYSIQEIALKSGFQNQYYFSRYFKKIAGMTPSEYRSISILTHTVKTLQENNHAPKNK